MVINVPPIFLLRLIIQGVLKSEFWLLTAGLNQHCACVLFITFVELVGMRHKGFFLYSVYTVLMFLPFYHVTRGQLICVFFLSSEMFNLLKIFFFYFKEFIPSLLRHVCFAPPITTSLCKSAANCGIFQ